MKLRIWKFIEVLKYKTLRIDVHDEFVITISYNKNYEQQNNMNL